MFATQSQGLCDTGAPGREPAPGMFRKTLRGARGAVARHLLLTGGDASAAAGRSCSERPRPQAGESDAHKQNEGEEKKGELRKVSKAAIGGGSFKDRTQLEM